MKECSYFPLEKNILHNEQFEHIQVEIKKNFNTCVIDGSF